MIRNYVVSSGGDEGRSPQAGVWVSPPSEDDSAVVRNLAARAVKKQFTSCVDKVGSSK